MNLGIAYWIVMLLWLVLGLFWTWPNYHMTGLNILLFLLLLIAGWKMFGPPLHS